MNDTAPVQRADSETTSDKGGSHTRTYQACIPCRRRKVRCDLGPVDKPHDPPCVRCRRESKECFFSSERRKKRALDSGEGAEELTVDALELHGGRKRLKTSGSNDYAASLSPSFTSQPLTPGGSRGRLQPLRRPGNADVGGSAMDQSFEDDEQTTSRAMEILQQSEVHSGHDALQLLLVAAQGQASSEDGMQSTTSPSSARHPKLDARSASYFGRAPGGSAQAKELTSALRVWSRFRFVRAGWMTAQEGMNYVEYFYKHLSPLTPVVMPDYSAPSSHSVLLEEEPVLAVTILTLASRHMQLAGPGAQSRPYAMHQMLWTYLEGMINRLTWGQEQFGGGFIGGGGPPGGGAQAGCDVNPYNKKGLRTLGTVESLLLLTEWHPRSMHFPPNEDDAELMVPEGPVAVLEPDDEGVAKGIGGQRLDTWLEPCWRSDRICWMLLSLAQSLAFEIGVFDSDNSRHATDDPAVSAEKQQSYEERRIHVKNLLLVYTTQTSCRLGLVSMLPAQYSEPSMSNEFQRQAGNFRGTKDAVIYFWLRMSAVTKAGNMKLFANRHYTREIIRDGRYQRHMHDLQPSLKSFREEFDACKQIPPLMRCILTIEFEYVRVYLNSLGLQAVVERFTGSSPFQAKPSPHSTNGATSHKAIPQETLERWFGGDRFHINEVIQGSRNLLKAVVDGLASQGHLRQAPVRTFFRIISVSIILLKTFALGATADEVAISLGYMDRTITALRTCIVDDVHVASRFADLLDVAVNRIRSRLVRTRNGASGMSRVASQSPAPYQQPMQHRPVTAHATPMQNSFGRQDAFSQQSWQYSGGMLGATTMNGRDTPSHPLHGISTQAFDLNDNGLAFSIMPPPIYGDAGAANGMGYNSLGGDNAYDSYGIDPNMDYTTVGNEMPDWLALPLEPLLNSRGADVTQSGYGPIYGDSDMLELLLGGDGMMS